MGSSDSVRVLVLEDDPDFALLVRKQLRRLSGEYHVEMADCLAEALEKLSTQWFDVVLSDLSLPDSSGLKTIAKLRDGHGDLPVIVLTNLEDDLVEAEILRSGAQDYLIKGEVSDRELCRAISHAVQRQRSANETRELVAELEQSRKQLARQSRLLKKKNRRLKRLYNTGQEFVDNVSHDFRTPLAVIKDYVDIIQEGLVGEVNEEQKGLLEKVSIRADDLNTMVDDLLDVSKLDMGLIGLSRRNVSPAELLRRTESLLRQRAGAKGVEFAIECAADLPEVYCDAEKVDRVITNLAVNAIKFSGQGKCVRITAELDLAEREVVFRVSDTGPGIDPEILETLFNRFQQCGTQLKATVKGFGLGLNIAQQFCQLNLGEISVTSQLGKGSTFSFSLPLADPVEVVRRWHERFSKPDDCLCLHEVVVEAENTKDFNAFLNYQVRVRDLLFCLSPHRWLLLVATPLGEEQQWAERIAQEHERFNRNRPYGPLPSYRTAQLAEWSGERSPRELLAEFASLLEQRAEELPCMTLISEGEQTNG